MVETNITTSSNISAQWLTVPEVARLSDDSSTADMPSALLSVQIPYFDSNDTGMTMSCSVDARWAIGTYSGGPVGDLDVDYVQKATIQNTRPFAPDLPGYQYNFLPIDDGSWRRVQIDVDWLNALTPALDSNISNWTSLTALLAAMGVDNSTGVITDSGDISIMLESVVAALVADGMSRQGYADNGGSSVQITDALNLLPWDSSASSQQSILAGTYAFPPPPGTATQLHWAVVVSGYAYRADSVAYYLALTVLFLHAVLALGHVVYVLWKRVCCDAWDSLVGLLVLTAQSGTLGAPGPGGSDVFKNASAGIRQQRTMSTPVRVRAFPAAGATTPSQEDVKILFGDQALSAGYLKLEDEKAYG